MSGRSLIRRRSRPASLSPVDTSSLPSTSTPINPLLPLSSHYSLLQTTLLPAFVRSLTERSYGIAYAVGVQFVELALVGIPSHAYYDQKDKADSCEREHAKSVRDALRIATLLEELVKNERVADSANSANSAEGGTRSTSSKGDTEAAATYLEEVHKLKMMAEDAARAIDCSGGVGGSSIAKDMSWKDWTSATLEDGGHSTTEEPSVWDWVAVQADGMCDRLRDDFCSMGPGPSTFQSNNDTEMEDDGPAPYSPAEEERQYQQDLERALYLSGLDAARVESLTSAADEEKRRRKKKEKEEYVPEHHHSRRRRKRRDHPTEEDAVVVLRQSAPANAATSDPADGRDGPDDDSTASPFHPPALPTAHSDNPPPPPPPLPVNTMPHTIADLCRDDFHTLLTAGQIRIYPLRTVQGRVAGSVNGCTVIAPLMVLAHLRGEGGSSKQKQQRSERSIDMLDDMDWETTDIPAASSSSSHVLVHHDGVDDDDYGVSDATLEGVIDDDAPSILPLIRAKLDLGQNALIIPSDVHDYLIDAGLLQQNQFVNVFGGNILDDDHLGVFLNALAGNSKNDDERDKRMGATLFFHEHVICLHQIIVKKRTQCRNPRKHGVPIKKGFFRGKKRNCQGIDDDKEHVVVYFDVIDSLPVAQMLSQGSFIDQYHESRDVIPEGLDSTIVLRDCAARIRCCSVEVLSALLRHYAYSKFSDKDHAHISRCVWNDSAADFDPRTFQAFVWRSQPACD